MRIIAYPLGFLVTIFGITGAAQLANTSIPTEGFIGITIAAIIGGAITGGFVSTDNTPVKEDEEE